MNTAQIRNAKYQAKFHADGGEIRVVASQAEVGIKHLREDAPGIFTAASAAPFTVEVFQRAASSNPRYDGQIRG